MSRPYSIGYCHCGDHHTASSKDCLRYKFEREVLLIRNKKVSFVEAKHLALAQPVSPGKPLVSVIQSHVQRQLTAAQSLATSRTSPPILLAGAVA